MRVLLVEDDENKRKQIESFLRETYTGIVVSNANSYQTGLRLLIAESFEWVLLDMSLPTFDMTSEEEGGRPQAFGGRQLLRQMRRRNISPRVIVITQFDKFGESAESLTREELDQELNQSHPATYRGMVYYNAALAGWKEELIALLMHT